MRVTPMSTKAALYEGVMGVSAARIALWPLSLCSLYGYECSTVLTATQSDSLTILFITVTVY
jgi:hypothetical protein